MKPPARDIDPDAFWHDPYPALREMRETAPLCHVPQLDAVLMTRRDDIFICEKNTRIFSSEQPGGLMTRLMGENMMRKDGAPHMEERRQAFPALSPRTVRDVWKRKFGDDTDTILDGLKDKSEIDIVRDYALPVSANALRHITGLTNLTTTQMDEVSQAMIDGIANYSGDRATEMRCHAATALIDQAIDERRSFLRRNPDTSLLAVLQEAGQEMTHVRANIKLAISGGQNEPRDAIAGMVWALLTHPAEYTLIKDGNASWMQAFEEYARWISPIGMSPRRIAAAFTWKGIDLEPDTRCFLMFGSANRDDSIFEDPDRFCITRDTSRAISFGAGPHFCAGAAASRALIADIALPKLFERFPDLTLHGPARFGGWAFRGPLSVVVRPG